MNARKKEDECTKKGGWTRKERTMNAHKTYNERTWNGRSTTLNEIIEYTCTNRTFPYCYKWKEEPEESYTALMYGSAIEPKHHRKLHAGRKYNGKQMQRNENVAAGLYGSITGAAIQWTLIHFVCWIFGLCIGIIGCFQKNNRDIYQEIGNRIIGKLKSIISSGLPRVDDSSLVYLVYTRVANLTIAIHKPTLNS